jgi:nucleoside-diphosphate-sugar epimerase
MRVVVTGAGGFIGSHLTEALLREGHSVRALAHYNGAGNFGHLEPLQHIPGADRLVRCNADTAKRVLGWSPRVSLDEGLRRTQST